MQTFHMAIKEDANNIKRLDILFVKEGNTFKLNMTSFDSEGYYQAHNSRTIFQSFDFNQADDQFNSLVDRKKMTLVY